MAEGEGMSITEALEDILIRVLIEAQETLDVQDAVNAPEEIR